MCVCVLFLLFLPSRMFFLASNLPFKHLFSLKAVLYCSLLGEVHSNLRHAWSTPSWMVECGGGFGRTTLLQPAKYPFTYLPAWVSLPLENHLQVSHYLCILSNRQSVEHIRVYLLRELTPCSHSHLHTMF